MANNQGIFGSSNAAAYGALSEEPSSSHPFRQTLPRRFMLTAIAVLLSVAMLSALAGREFLGDVSLPSFGERVTRISTSNVPVNFGPIVNKKTGISMFGGSSETKAHHRYSMRASCKEGQSMTACWCGPSSCSVLSGSNPTNDGCACAWEGKRHSTSSHRLLIYMNCA